MTAKFNELVAKIKEIFQIDKPDLDFGIYRILKARQKEISDFLEKRLAQKVKESLAGNAANEEKSLKRELDEKIAQAKSLGADPDTLPAVKELKARLAALDSGEQSESEVYSHLLTFFSRYYDEGDFISKRRYKGETYAIPYSGEEVKLHWANADQYYIKSGESFTNYAFSLDDGAKVHFTLVAADTAKDNVKDSDCVRCFVLWNPENTPEELDEDEAKRYPSDFLEEKDGELYIYFQYLKFKKGTKQKELLEEAAKKILPRIYQTPKFQALGAKAPTEKDKERTLLKKHLERYTAKNTSDYFIHKDLRGFLTRELDFYIKNEMMQLDDIADAKTFRQIETNLRKIQSVRVIATELIDFMAQLENFQKKLWLKKKFVVQCDYCITMDQVPEDLRPEVLSNQAQLEEWKKYEIDVDPKTVDMHAIDARMVDTKFFDETFKAKLLRSISDLDERCDGLLIHSENFGALNLLQERYRQQVKCIYIDPPYNTDASKILYKNGYEHSSWISLLHDRLEVSKRLLSDKGVLEAAIDDYEFRYLNLCIESVFGAENNLSTIAIQTNPKGRDQGFIAQAHDYTIMYGVNKSKTETYSFKLSPEEVAKKFSKGGAEGVALRELPLKRTGSDKYRENRPHMYFPFLYEAQRHSLRLIPEDEYVQIYVNDNFDDGFVELLCEKYSNVGLEVILPISENGEKLRWRWGYKACVEGVKNGTLFCKRLKDGKYAVYQRDMADDEATPKSFWTGERYDASSKGTNILNSILPGNPFDYPKSLYTAIDCLTIGMGTSNIVLDYFAGSGTTGHAVIELNREDGGKRKYILVEMGDHFDTVLKPRIEKVVYSPDWKDGKPQSSDKGISHCFKYMTLESYEDALNNIELTNAGESLEGVLKDEFLLKYMIDLQARGSIINTDDFRKPFDYELKIAADSSGASEKRKIDLVETFNYLIGLKVVGEDRRLERGYIIVEGFLPGDDTTSLIVWRDCEKIDNTALNKLLERLAVRPGDSEFKCIFVNGDHAIANKKLGTDEGAPELKIRQIENVFLEKMFEEA